MPVPTHRVLVQEARFYAEFRPYQEVELHARVSGYLDKMLVDFGQQVKSNQLLVTIEVPELKDQLASAEATQQEMQAAYAASHLEYQRISTAAESRPGLIAQQQIDDLRARDLKDEQAIADARAKADQLRTMLAYTQITAPFAGEITWRYVDPGALIQAGTASTSGSLPLLRLSQNDLLRLDFPVSISFVPDVREGTPVEIQVEGFAQPISGKVTRITGRVDESTRTMTAEVEVPNPDLKLVPGMYATVTVQVEQRPQVLAVPPEAIERGAQPSVLVVANQTVEERPVRLGRKRPRRVESAGGLNANEQVIISGRGLVHPGDRVTAKTVAKEECVMPFL